MLMYYTQQPEEEEEEAHDRISTPFSESPPLRTAQR